MLLAPEGDPDAPDIPTPRSYAEAIMGPYSSQWQTTKEAEMASWNSTGTYVDVVPPPGPNIVDGMWIFRVKRSPGSPPVFKARYIARGFSQRQGVDFFQTFSPTPKMTTLRSTAAPIMASPTLLTFDAEGRAVAFDVWLDDLQLFLQCNSKDGLSLFDLTSGASTAPAADADSTVRSQWLTHDAAAHLAVRSHLPATERAHFSQYKSAKTLYDAVVARYSSPATAALSRLMLPYMFPVLAAFATVTDIITHLRTSDTRYRAALPAEFCAANPPPMYITLYYLVTRLPDTLRSQQRSRETPSPQQLREWYAGRQGSGGAGPCTYVLRTGDRTGEQCGGLHATQHCFGRLTDAWCAQFPDANEIPRWSDLLRSGVAIFDLDFDALLPAMYAVSISAEGDCYVCVPPDPGIEAAALGASKSAAPGTGESALSGTASAQVFHTFTLDSGASRSFFRDRTTLTPLSRPVAVSLADPSVSNSSEFPPTEALLLTLHMDMWGPARVRGQGHERYFLLVVDVYSRYTTVFPLRSKGEVTEVLIDWIRVARLQLRERFGSDFPVLRLHSDRGGEYSSDLLRAFCRAEGIRQTFTLPASPQQNGIAERRIGMVMDVTRTSMIRVAAPHFLWPFAVQYAAHQINLQPRVSLPETSPTLRWTGKVGDASAFRVLGSRAFVRDLSADKLSSRAVPCDVTFDESVPYYRLFPYRIAPLPPPPLFLAPGPPPVDPLPPHGPAPSGVSHVDAVKPVEVAADSGASGGAEPERAEPGGAESGGAEPERAESGGAGPGGAELGGARSRGAVPEHAEPGGAASGGAEPGAARSGGVEPAGAGPGGPSAGGAAAAGGSAATGGPRAGGATGAGTGGSTSAGGAGATGPGGSRAGGTGAAGPAGAPGAGAGGAVGVGATAGTGAGAGVSAGGPAGAGAAGGLGAGGAARGGADAGGAGVVPAGPVGAARSRPYFVPLLEQVLGLLPSPSPAPSLACPPPVQSESQLQLASPLPAPSPYAVPSMHQMALCPSTAQQRVPFPSPPESSLPALADPTSDSLRAVSPTVTRLLATVVTDPSFESTAASALVTELVDFAAHCRLDYAASLVAESASVCPPSVGEGPYSSQWQAAMNAEMASWNSTGTYVDEVPPPGANIVSGMWIFRVKRPPGSPPVFKARYVARGFSQRQGGSLHKEIWLRRPPGFTGSFPPGTQWSLRRPVYGLRQAPREWHDTLRTTLAALGFAPSTADPSLFLCIDTLLPPFYILVYVDDLVFATADTAGLAHVKSELQKRHTCTDLGELRSYLGLQITRDRARRTVTLTQSHMVQQVLQRFDFMYSSPQATPLSTRHSLSALPSD
ncbi:unnamed protein product [Closterium sp. NIES-54]